MSALSIAEGRFSPLPLLTTRPVRLAASMWPSCALCGCDLNTCAINDRCDPDEAAGAALAAMLNRPSKGEA